MKVKHCVSMVTYNHEKWIDVALASIFDNKVLPDIVILFDDCSSDKTWEKVQMWKDKYPQILECHRNKENVGLYRNVNQCWQAAVNSGVDVISECAGDDYLKKGLIEELNRVIEEEKIDYKNEKFIIITNSEELYLDGSIKLIDNYKYRNAKDIGYLRARGEISYREVGLSANLMKTVSPIRSDVGLESDFLFCMEYERKCEHFYFTPFVGSCYRLGVGVTSVNKQTDLGKEKVALNNIVINTYDVSDATKNYLRFENSYYMLLQNYSFSNWISYLIKFLMFGKKNRSALFMLIHPKAKKVIKRILRKEK